MKALERQLLRPDLFKIDNEKDQIGKIPKDSVEYLPFLQDKLKRDSEAYKGQFMRILPKLQENLSLIKQNPTEENEEAQNYLRFFSQVAFLFQKTLAHLPQEISLILEQYYDALNPILRLTLVECVVILTKRGLISHLSSIPLLFKLFRCKDKQLGKVLKAKIIGELKLLNKLKKAATINKSLQNFVYEMLKDDNYKAARKSLQVAIELYRKNIWNDSKTVNVIADGCLHKHSKISRLACQFLLQPREIDTNQDQSEEEDSKKNLLEALAVLRKKHRGKTKFTRKQKEKMERQMSLLERKSRRKSRVKYVVDFMPIDLLHDPAGLADKLFSKLKRASDNFETRIAIMKLVARLVGRHYLAIPSFYTYVGGKYLNPKQKELSSILALLAQACHDQTPVEEVEPVVQKIIDNFLNERSNSALQLTIGLNTLLEIIRRMPLVVTEAQIEYLGAFRNYKNKSVRAALKGVVNILRDKRPQILEKKMRGRVAIEEASREENTGAYSGVEGVELLQQYEGYEGGRLDQEQVLDNKDLKKIKYLKMKRAAERQSRTLAKVFNPDGKGRQNQAEEDELEKLEQLIQENYFEEEEQSDEEAGEESQEEEAEEEQESELDEVEQESQEEEKDEEGEVIQFEEGEEALMADQEQKLSDIIEEFNDSDWEDQNEGGNEHGFIEAGRLDTYRRSKAEKREEREIQITKLGGKESVKKLKKLERKGQHHESKTEKSRKKNKPLAMVMPKKKMELHQQLRSLKEKMKRIKTLSKVRDGKLRVKRRK